MHNLKHRNAQPYYIGTDIGTGSAKAVALGPDKKILATAQSFYSVISPRPGYSELDPSTIRTAFAHVNRDLILQLKRPPASIGISTAMHSVMAVDGNHRPLTRFLTWEDTRGDKIAASLRAAPLGRRIYEATGTPVHSMSPLCKIRWLMENLPAVYSKARKFISIKEYLWFELFGEYEVDHSIASATGLFNLEKRMWHPASLRYCGITASRLSRPVATSFTRDKASGPLARSLQVTSKTLFCIGASDGCLANVGSYATRTHTAALTIGTSAAIRIASRKPVVDFGSMIFNYILDEKTYISGGPVNNGGNVMKWMFSTFLGNNTPGDADYLAAFAEIGKIAPGADGLIFLPYLYGERAPVWDEQSSGVFLGIRSFHTPHHFFRAAVEGICFSLKEILINLEKVPGSIRELSVSGGFVHSAVWMQILADITGKKLCKTQAADASCVGAALLSMKAAGAIRNYAPPKSGSPLSIGPRRGATGRYERSFTLFRRLYPALKEDMHKLQALVAMP